MAWAGRGWWALKAAVGVTPVLVTLEDWVLTVVPCRDTLMQVSVPNCPLAVGPSPLALLLSLAARCGHVPATALTRARSPCPVCMDKVVIALRCSRVWGRVTQNPTAAVFAVVLSHAPSKAAQRRAERSSL